MSPPLLWATCAPQFDHPNVKASLLHTIDGVVCLAESAQERDAARAWSSLKQ